MFKAVGKPRGGSRRGRPNKATQVREQFYGKQGIVPLDFMLAVLRDPDMPFEERKWAAVSAARFIHPALSQMDMRALAVMNAQVGDACLDPLSMTYEERAFMREMMARQTMLAIAASSDDTLEGELAERAA